MNNSGKAIDSMHAHFARGVTDYQSDRQVTDTMGAKVVLSNATKISRGIALSFKDSSSRRIWNY